MEIFCPEMPAMRCSTAHAARRDHCRSCLPLEMELLNLGPFLCSVCQPTRALNPEGAQQ